MSLEGGACGDKKASQRGVSWGTVKGCLLFDLQRVFWRSSCRVRAPRGAPCPAQCRGDTAREATLHFTPLLTASCRWIQPVHIPKNQKARKQALLFGLVWERCQHPPPSLPVTVGADPEHRSSAVPSLHSGHAPRDAQFSSVHFAPKKWPSLRYRSDVFHLTAAPLDLPHS